MTTEPMGAEAPTVTGGDLPGAAQQSQAELDAQEERARTTYVLLVERAELEAVWEEIARITAASREAAWEEAKRRHADTVVPRDDGAQISAQLVPERFFRRITATLRRPEPQVEVEGL